MHPEIAHQKQLMEQALGCLRDIETVNSFIRPLNKVIATKMIHGYMSTYAECMAELATSICSVPHDYATSTA
jgi:hypothetical protein